MTIKLAILKSGENIISDIKEGFYEERLVCYILENPCQVKITGSYSLDGKENRHTISLNNWPILSKEKVVEVTPESIITLVDPVDKLRDLYENQALKDIKNDEHKISLIDHESDNSDSN